MLFGEPTVALRGPWNAADLVKIGPSVADLVGRYEYHLDFPGNPLDPGCDYERWANRLTAGSSPTVTETFTVINYVIAGEDGRTVYRTCIESRKGRRCAPGTVPPLPP